MKRTGSVMVAGLLLASCSTLAAREEWGAYRAFRYESNSDQRTTLGARYLERYPNGRFRAQVEAEVGNREEEFWDQRRSTLEGLQAYLAAFPTGQHAQEARQRIAVYQAERDRVARERAANAAAERERLAAERRAANERQRLFARNTFLYWLRTLGGLDGWGEPIPAVAQRNPEFNAAFGAQPPPVCRAGRCRKAFQVACTVPIPGRTALSRQLLPTLDLVLRERRVVQAALVFQRRGLGTWFECETQTPVESGDADAQGQAQRWALDQLKGLVATAFPDARETPPELLGPPPEMESPSDDDDPEAGRRRAAQAAQPIPAQPLGVVWSYVVGCEGRGGPVIEAPEDAPAATWDSAQTSVQPTACLRIDAYAAPDVEGVRTDEGLRISWINPSSGATSAPVNTGP